MPEQPVTAPAPTPTPDDLAALAALAAANQIAIEWTPDDRDRWVVVDRNTADPDVNWPGELLSEEVAYDEAVAIRDRYRAAILGRWKRGEPRLDTRRALEDQ